MTAKEKSEELYKMFQKHAMYWDCYNDEALEEDHAKQCAIICVEEILNANPIVPLEYMLESEALDKAREYWQSVKTEIEKL
jgi:hypothetical protein